MNLFTYISPLSAAAPVRADAVLPCEPGENTREIFPKISQKMFEEVRNYLKHTHTHTHTQSSRPLEKGAKE
jgi:hypothetical protein